MKKALGALLCLVILGVIGFFALSGSGSNPAGEAASNAKAAATNAVIDATGVKGKAQDALKQHSDAIAAATGLTTAEVNDAIASLDIDGWKVVPLPADAVATDTVDASTLGIDGTVTVYDDPSYVTLNAYGQNATFEVPASAQASISSLASLG